MPRTKTIRHVQVPTSLDWAKHYDAMYRRSPRYKESMARVATHAKLQAEYFARPARRARERDEREEFESRLKFKAEFNAGQMELRYSQKQKREMDRLQMVPQLARQSGIFSEDQIDKIDQKVMLDIMGFTPTEQFKLTSYPKGEGVGDIYQQRGVDVSRKSDGETWQIDHRKTQAGQAAEHELKATQDQAKLQASIDAEKRAFERDLYTKEVLSADGLTKRSRTPEEVRQILRGYGRSNEVNKAKDLVAEFKSKFSNVDEIPENMRKQFFDAVDLISDTEAKGSMPTVSSDSDYDKLPSGAEFIDSEGNKWRKP